MFTLPRTRADRQPHFGQGKPVSRWAWHQRCDSSVPVLRWGPGRTKKGRKRRALVCPSFLVLRRRKKCWKGTAQEAKTQQEDGMPRRKLSLILLRAAFRACLHEADGPS